MYISKEMHIEFDPVTANKHQLNHRDQQLAWFYQHKWGSPTAKNEGSSKKIYG
jgi:hypothetical protein